MPTAAAAGSSGVGVNNRRARRGVAAWRHAAGRQSLVHGSGYCCSRNGATRSHAVLRCSYSTSHSHDV